MKKLILTACVIWLITGSCTEKKQTPELGGVLINHIITAMTDIMVHDVTNPPLAARFFAYTCLSGYEIVSQHDSSCQDMHGLLNGYPDIKMPDIDGAYSVQLSALLSMIYTAKALQPTGKTLGTFEKQLLDSCRQLGFSEKVIMHSGQYADSISKQVLKYAAADGYSRISNLSRYSPLEKEGSWYPTPPGYFAAVEPYFKTVRTLTLDSPAQFKPPPPVAFSSDKRSEFFKLMEENYKAAPALLPDEHRAIAAFWDCNPFAIQDDGHLMFGLKKISPGAHWLGITGIACMEAKKNFAATMKINTAVAIGLMDAFISCWDEKYRSNRIRPETAIRKYIDPLWKPLLQTPPFPEYTSGHSTISASSAYILGYYLGDDYAFTDSVEVSYGLPARHFSSFRQAALEAAVSRFYGGIHFRDANVNGTQQGTQVGKWVIHKIEKNCTSCRVSVNKLL